VCWHKQEFPLEYWGRLSKWNNQNIMSLFIFLLPQDPNVDREFLGVKLACTKLGTSKVIPPYSVQYLGFD